MEKVNVFIDINDFCFDETLSKNVIELIKALAEEGKHKTYVLVLTENSLDKKKWIEEYISEVEQPNILCTSPEIMKDYLDENTINVLIGENLENIDFPKLIKVRVLTENSPLPDAKESFITFDDSVYKNYNYINELAYKKVLKKS